MLALDDHMSKKMDKIAFHKSVHGLSAPRAVSGAASLPKPFVFTQINWMNHKPKIDPKKLKRMEALAM